MIKKLSERDIKEKVKGFREAGIIKKEEIEKEMEKWLEKINFPYCARGIVFHIMEKNL